MATGRNVSTNFIGNDYYGNVIIYPYTSDLFICPNPISTEPTSNGHYWLTAGYVAQWRLWHEGTRSKDPDKTGLVVSHTHSGLPTPPTNEYKFTDIDSCANVVNAALAAVGKQSDMDLGETLGGLKDTFSMIGDRTKQAAEVVHYVRRRDARGALATLLGRPVSKHEVKKSSIRKIREGSMDAGNLASGWFLENIFGWQQLLSDIDNGIKIIHEGVESGSRHGIVAGYASESVTKTVNGWPGYTYYYYGSTNHKWSIKSVAKCKFIYVFTHPSAGRTLNQLGLLNIPSLAWKLSRLSFVADWFLPIGTYLDGFTAPVGLTFKTSSLTIYNRAISSADPYIGPLPRLTTKLTEVPSVDTGTFNRFIVDPVPIFPNFRVPDSIDQAVVGAALLLQNLTNRRR